MMIYLSAEHLQIGSSNWGFLWAGESFHGGPQKNLQFLDGALEETVEVDGAGSRLSLLILMRPDEQGEPPLSKLTPSTMDVACHRARVS
jgi:hypothetical protein